MELETKLAGAAKAGTIESRNGSATAAPTPFRNVRRGSALPVTIIRVPSWKPGS
jgi:hypothetical protein